MLLGRSAAAFGRRWASTAGPLEFASSCSLPTSFVELPLLAARPVSRDASVFEFGLPAGASSLDLPVCACILMRAPDGAGGDHVRPYTPVSAPDRDDGSFELLVKRYDDGVASSWLHGLQPGAAGEGSVVGFKHIALNVKVPLPFAGEHAGVRKLLMLAGGTGVAPMFQALTRLLGGGGGGGGGLPAAGGAPPQQPEEIVLVLGNKGEGDILLREELDALAAAHPGRLAVHHVLGEAAAATAAAGWAGEVGWVDAEKVARLGFAPADDVAVFVCGLPALYESLCGAREEPGVAPASVLGQLGFADKHVFKF